MISSNKYFFLKTSLHVLIESFNKKLFSTAIISIFVLNLNRLKESKISYYRLHSLSQIIYILIRSLQQVIILLILKKKSGKHVIFLVSLLIMFYQLNFVFTWDAGTLCSLIYEILVCSRRVWTHPQRGELQQRCALLWGFHWEKCICCCGSNLSSQLHCQRSGW